MTREIKFRAYKEGIGMQYQESISDWSYWGDVIFQDPEYKIMQSTGLHDKNGKKIYEGDIVRTYAKDGGVGVAVWEIIYDAPRFKGRTHLKGTEPQIHGFPHPTHSEVIGNIYQNSELLTNNKSNG